MKQFALLFMSACAVLATAQTKPSPARMRIIEEAAYNRLTDQNDAWFHDGDYPRLVENLRYMNLIWPHDYETATNLGWMLGNIEHYDEELAVYKTYGRNNRQDPDCDLPEANLYSRNHQWAKIPAVLERDIPRRPHPNAYRILAHAYEHLNRLADASRIWKKYITDYPGDSAAVANLARVTRKLKANQVTTKG